MIQVAQGVKPSLGYMKACLKAKEGVGRREGGGREERGKGRQESKCLQSKVPRRTLLGLWYLLQTRKPTLPDTYLIPEQ